MQNTQQRYIEGAKEEKKKFFFCQIFEKKYEIKFIIIISFKFFYIFVLAVISKFAF